MDISILIARLDEILAQAQNQLQGVNSLESLETSKIEVLGKKGQLTELMKSLGALSAEDRPKVGQRANEVRAQITAAIESKLQSLESSKWETQLVADRIDVSLPGRKYSKVQREHPIQRTLRDLVRIFERCGFLVELGPEVEHEFYNFDALNIPPSHPSRALQDTFYIKNTGGQNVVLRTHTSPVQIRTLLASKPPVRMICPGRVYRADYDATHTPMFHQIEGLLVDEKVQLGELIGILSHMVREFFGEALKVRLRPSFFPFTEPSAEIDIQCPFCKGKGCKTCKSSGWVEIGGSGMIDPEVFKAVGMDVEKVRGFAFGMGIERMAMLKYGVDDLRAFFESDIRFISQFGKWNT